MQLAASDALDLTQESAKTREMYGIGQEGEVDSRLQPGKPYLRYVHYSAATAAEVTRNGAVQNRERRAW